MKVAIIGAGVAGSCVLRTLIEQAPLDQLQAIDVYEYREESSKGLPYEKDDTTLWLNSAAHRVSCDPDHPLDFVDWLKKNHVDEEIIQTLVPRPYYGEYLHQRFLPYFDHPLVHFIPERVVDFQVQKNKKPGALTAFSYRLQCESSKQWSDDYQAVFLALGHPPYADYYQLDSYESFIRQVYPAATQLSDLDPDQSIGIVGSGATSFDILRYLDKHYDSDRPWTLYIRTTPFSSTKVELEGEPHLPSIDADWIERHREVESSNIPLDLIYQQVQDDFESFGVDFKLVCQQHGLGDLSENIRQYFSSPRQVGVVQEYLSYLTPVLPDLYQALSQEDQNDYDLQMRPYVEHFRNVVPRPVMGMVIDWLKRDKLRIVSGLTDIQWNSERNSFDIYINNHQHEQVDILLNATGFDLRLNQAAKEDELINNLYNKHYITSSSQSGEGVAVSWPETQVLSQRYGLLERLYFLGHYIFPTQYANNNAQLNMKQARRSVEHFIQSMK